MIFYGVTDVGRKRAVNQDNFIIKKYSDDVTAAVVCDGMGGANGGNVASAVAADSFFAVLDKYEKEHPAFFGQSSDEFTGILSIAVSEANNSVFSMSQSDEFLAGMGTTLVGCVICGDRAYIVNVGDSRLYLVRGGMCVQMTHDHSYVQYLVDIGRLTPAEAKNSKNKNLITRAVGTEKSVDCDIFTSEIVEGDRLLLCSDGLSNLVENEEFAKKLESVSDFECAKDVCTSLVSLANERGGNDNITAVILGI